MAYSTTIARWGQSNNAVDGIKTVFSQLFHDLYDGTVTWVDSAVPGIGVVEPVTNAWGDDTSQVYTDAITAAAGGVNAVIYWGCEKDIREGIGRSATRTALQTMIANARSDLLDPKLPFYFVLPYRTLWDSTAVREAVQDVVSQDELVFLVADAQPYERYDDVHLTDDAYDEIAAEVFGSMYGTPDYLIGLFNSEHVRLGVLPRCLARGSSPAAFNTGQFPLYLGPKATGAEIATLSGMTVGYDSGVIDFTDATAELLFNFSPAHDNASKFGVLLWLNYIDKGSSQAFSSQYDDSSNYFFCQSTGAADQLEFRFRKSATNARFLASGSLAAGLRFMSHIKDAGFLHGYIDGAPIEAYTSQDTYNLGAFQLSQAFRVGRHDSLFDMRGALEGYLIYEGGVPPASEIEALAVMGPDLGGLRLYDEGDGTTILTPKNRLLCEADFDYSTP